MDSREWTDISYSYVIDPDSLKIYEGRGAGIRGGHTKNRNSISHAICVMGNFNNDKVTGNLINVIGALVAYGHKQGWWPSRLTGGHRDVVSTECPGDNLYAAIGQINTVAARILDSGGSGMPVNSATIAAFQRAVIGLGGDPGPVDGKNGPKTRAGAHWVYDELGGEPHRPAADIKALEDQLTAARSQLGNAQQELLKLQRQVDEWEELVGGDELDVVVRNHADMKALRDILKR